MGTCRKTQIEDGPMGGNGGRNLEAIWELGTRGSGVGGLIWRERTNGRWDVGRIGIFVSENDYGAFFFHVIVGAPSELALVSFVIF